MNEFMVLAFLMVAGACAIVIVPLIRGRRAADAESGPDRDEPVATASVVVVLVAVPLLAFVLYDALSGGVPDSAALTRAQAQVPAQSSGNLPSIEEMAAALEQRLTTQPDDQKGWQMLGRTYVAMQRFPEATLAYERALALSVDRAPALLLDFAEAMAMADPNSLATRGGELIEEALRSEPNNRKGLWYGGSAAFERGDFTVARDRWQTLANASPPEALVGPLNQRIADANEKLGIAGIAAGATAAAPAAPADRPSGAVAVAVSITPALSATVSPDSPLFVLARASTGGPPLAVVRRRAGDLPLDVTLSDADAMIPGRTISAQESVEFVARIALGGGPVANPGDLFGSVNYNVGDGSDVSILIDRVQP